MLANERDAFDVEEALVGSRRLEPPLQTKHRVRRERSGIGTRQFVDLFGLEDPTEALKHPHYDIDLRIREGRFDVIAAQLRSVRRSYAHDLIARRSRHVGVVEHDAL